MNQDQYFSLAWLVIAVGMANASIMVSLHGRVALGIVFGAIGLVALAISIWKDSKGTR